MAGNKARPARKKVQIKPAAPKRGGEKKRPAPAKGVGPKRAAVNPGAFLDLPPAASGYDSASVVVLPMPLEESVSYGGGTAKGPDAIITASQQVELYDARTDREPAMIFGVHTLPAPAAFAKGKVDAAAAVNAIREETAKHLRAGKFVLALGGEHTASLGVAQGVAEAKGDFTLVHVDAHADLRDQYEGDPLSHACVVRRIAELPQCEAVLQLGIRSTTGEQMEFVRDHSGRKAKPYVRTWFAWDMHAGKAWRSELKQLVKGKQVFFTFDVDGLDSAVVPATGTPEPNGLTWRQLMRIAKIVGKNAAACVALDCVELAPAPGLHHADFTVARALYEMTTHLLLGD